MTSLYPRLPEHLESGPFEQPVKKIHDGEDVHFFLTSLAYRDVMTFVLQLNHAMVPRKSVSGGQVARWRLDGITQESLSTPVKSLQGLLSYLKDLVAEAPPETGPRRFGNISFRKWYQLVEARIDVLLSDCCLPSNFSDADVELKAYLLGSFGSAQRLDYGTGHELSFIAFIGGLWKLGYFTSPDKEAEERAIVLVLFQPYLELVRLLIKTYNLEPAGSHGVWGLDDNSFLPYVFGSAQLCPAISANDETPIEGSDPIAPDPSTVTKRNEVEKEKVHNLYFAAVAFIYDVKKGPFWEHSPILFDISGIKDGWGKINKGMLKMYNAEVLSKFPVVQHFPFGSLFRWAKDPQAKPPPLSAHASSQPLRNPAGDSLAPSTARPQRVVPQTTAPYGRSSNVATPGMGPAARVPPPPTGFVDGVTKAPWASQTSAPPASTGGRFVAPARGPVPRAKPKPEVIPETQTPLGKH